MKCFFIELFNRNKADLVSDSRAFCVLFVLPHTCHGAGPDVTRRTAVFMFLITTHLTLLHSSRFALILIRHLQESSLALTRHTSS